MADSQAAAQAVQTTLGTPTIESVGFFFLIVACTLVITYWAAKNGPDQFRNFTPQAAP